ncbi:M48 family metallopeptidase [Glaciecola sp. MF2-115]|uniref:M48 family metallopeptidase n=1 Tax=Glaciecola sp. MF2-115 TaxID=3384827 RepID=UPI0039A258F5
MATLHCANCNFSFPDTMLKCPSCGTSQNTAHDVLEPNTKSTIQTNMPDLPLKNRVSKSSYKAIHENSNTHNRPKIQRAHPIKWLSKPVVYFIVIASFVSVLLIINASNGITSYLASITSVKLERSLSAPVVMELERISDSNQTSYRIQQLGQSLVSSMYPRSEYEYKFYLLNDSDSQAFALPGGYIVVYQGLYDLLSEGELKGVLAHEIQHVELKHGLKSLYADMGLSSVVTLIFSAGGDVAFPLKTLYALKYSRGLETEADLYGADLLIEAGIKPTNLAHALSKLGRASGTDGMPEWLKSHPEIDTRINNLNQYIATK